MEHETSVQQICKNLTERQAYLLNFLLQKNSNEVVLDLVELGTTMGGVQRLMADLMELQATSFWTATADGGEELVAVVDEARVIWSEGKIYVRLGAAAAVLTQNDL